MPARKPKTKWGDREGRRADLLAAGRTLLAKGGYARLNMRDVARGARVALGSVYTYFGSREELFAALYTERLVALHDEIAPIVASARSLEQLFVGVAGAYLDVYRVYGREVNLWSAIADASDLPRELAQPLVDAATRVLFVVGEGLTRHAGARGVRLERPDLALPFLWATLNGLCDHFTGHRHELHGFTWDELAGFAARTLVAGLTKKER